MVTTFSSKLATAFYVLCAVFAILAVLSVFSLIIGAANGEWDRIINSFLCMCGFAVASVHSAATSQLLEAAHRYLKNN